MPVQRWNRRTQSNRTIALVAPLAVLSILMADSSRAPRFVWNASASTPTGLYWMAPARARRGDLVGLRLPASIAAFAAGRGYLPDIALLLKPIAGREGDRVCRWGARLFVNGVIRARASARDGADRSLPTWHGCVRLTIDHVIVLGASRDSFDSRYFGPIPTSAILGRAIPVWTPQD
jgi:conjugative transfer signal peptidase TraF